MPAGGFYEVPVGGFFFLGDAMTADAFSNCHPAVNFLFFAAAIVLTVVLGFVIERVAYRPLRDAPRISALISAIAVSFFIESLAVVVFTGQPRPVLQPEWLVSEWQVGGLRILRLTAFKDSAVMTHLSSLTLGITCGTLFYIRKYKHTKKTSAMYSIITILLVIMCLLYTTFGILGLLGFLG